VTDLAEFTLADTGEGEGVEHDDNRLAPELGQRDVAALLILEREIGRGVADCHHRVFLPRRVSRDYRAAPGSLGESEMQKTRWSANMYEDPDGQRVGSSTVSTMRPAWGVSHEVR